MSAIYIDPTARIDGDGSINSPRNTFPTIVSDTEYYLKRGTRLIQTQIIAVFTGDTPLGTTDVYGVTRRTPLGTIGAVEPRLGIRPEAGTRPAI